MSAEKSKTEAVVLALVEPLVGKGTAVWIDNFCSEPVQERHTKNSER
jgi:hypothetical protein